MRPRRVIVSVLLFSAAPLAGCVDHDPPEMREPGEPDPDVDDAPADLVPLRNELLATPAATALASMTHFRPLCDAQGYPLVGNVANKMPTDGLQPSQFCAEVRKRP